jgi:prepilin signal peptidase PulO-like enzyme (type II secretory pathway)
MIVLYALTGVLAGSGLNWLSHRLPRYATSRVTLRAAPFTIAVWQLLAALIAHRRIASLPRTLWISAAAELVTAGLLAVPGQHFGFSWDFLRLAAMCCLLILIALIDLHYRLVLNVLIYPAIGLTLLVRLTSPDTTPVVTLLGGAIGLSMFLLAALLRPGELGGGDVKLATLIGLMFGFPHVLWALLLGIVAGGVFAIGLMARRHSRKLQIPYAPFLCLGAIIALLYNPLTAVFPV